MEHRNYTLIIEPAEDEQGPYFGGYFPDLPGCGSTGRTIGELRANAQEALAAHVEALRHTGQPVPKPVIVVEEVSIDVA
jgi:predicted RNase H-like HicB family nuclease